MARERQLPDYLQRKVVATQLQVFLGSMNYPAQKQQLIDQAKSKSAPDNIVQLLTRLPERRYDRSSDVQNEVNKIP